MPQLPLYEDSLVVLTSVSLLLKRYYFPTLKPKLVSLPKVQRIEILYPNLWTGTFHLWGSGDLITFYPLDFGWPKRDRIFGRHNGNKRVRIGFTVENSELFITAISLLPVSVSQKPSLLGENRLHGMPRGKSCRKNGSGSRRIVLLPASERNWPRVPSNPQSIR
jgi:hypothetical protein